ncbi:MAG: hypothetical protein IPF99_19980 [Deltaproteobacteria bacterium]|nr:hypothetical protein [Deltaproteobacteria bacterium]
MRRERAGWAGVFGATLVTAAVGCAGDGSGLDQSTEAIALAPTALVEPGIAESVQIGVRPGVSFSGGPGGWLAVWASPLWDNSPAVMAARIGATSVPLDRPAFTLTPTPDTGGSIGLGAALGDRWLTWNGSDGRLATVPAAGTPVVTRLSAQPCQNLVCDAAGCLCTSQGSSERLIAQRLDASGAPSGAAIFLGPSAFGTPAIAATATQWLTVFESTHPDTGAIDLRINRMLRDGTLRDGQGVPFTTIAAGRVQPAVATDGTAFLVVFVATAGSGSRLPGIYAQRVEASTNVVAGPPVLLVSGTDVASPSVAWDGARYWVAWQRLPGAPGQYARLGADGALVDATPRVLGSTSSRVFRPKVAVSAGRVAMLWQEGDLGAAWFQRFRADGTAESAATPISYQAPRWAQPALASNGSRFALSCYTPDGPSRAPAPG